VGSDGGEKVQDVLKGNEWLDERDATTRNQTIS
jgi:hypothetical protein